jgi:hypothetical protein
MNGILVPRLFKYVKAKTAITILENKTLQWSIPDSFNDPFEFKSPFAYGFEWDEMSEVALRRFAKILTQPEEPNLADGNPVAPKIKERRKECKGKDPNQVIELVRPKFRLLVQQWKENAIRDEEKWREDKKTYLVLCLSAVHNHILMWSHYAEAHRGAVFEFRPIIQLSNATLFGTPTLFAQPVVYSLEVPLAATLEDYVGYLAGEKPKPDTSNAFRKSVFTKSSVWAYESEWRVLDKKRTGDEGPSVLREFHPQELVTIYLGCRMPPEDRERIKAIVASWETPISLFRMRDERIRFELTAEPISI